MTRPPRPRAATDPPRPRAASSPPAPTESPRPASSPRGGSPPAPTESPRADSSPAPTESPRADSSPAPTESPRADSSPGASADSLRLFVALELPDPVREALVAFREAAADPEVWRPVPPEALHLTLAFLGRRPASDVATIEAVLRKAAGPAPRLALDGAVLLPPRRARVLCAALADPDSTLAALQSRVSDGLVAAGVYVPEKRPFRAHTTVARLRPRQRAPREVAAEPKPLEFHGDALTLFVSRLHPHGARYEALERVSLR